MSNIVPNKSGLCPYDGSANFTNESTLASRTIMQCTSCNKYSMRDNRGVQYPLQDPSDSNSSPTQLLKE